MGYNTCYSLKVNFLVGGKPVELVDNSFRFKEASLKPVRSNYAGLRQGYRRQRCPRPQR
jgi:hypothetical protein